jgi:hypothetical protein
MQAFVFDRTREPFRVRVAVGCAIGRLHDTHTRHLEQVANTAAPLPIAVATQDPS